MSKSIAMISVALEVTRFSPLPMWKFGASNGKKDHVDIRPPMLPIITVVPLSKIRVSSYYISCTCLGKTHCTYIAEERAVSEITFAETCALHSAPNEKAPIAIKNDAP